MISHANDSGHVPKLALNRVEAAEALGVSQATLDRLTLRGLLRPSRATRRPLYAVKEQRTRAVPQGNHDTRGMDGMNAFPGDAGAELSGPETSDGKRLWMTAEEVFAQIEAHRVARLKERQNPRKASGSSLVAGVYELNPDLKYKPKPKNPRSPEVAHE